jgi:AraC-like DNA-binding protein
MQEPLTNHERTRFWHDPDIAGLELLHARYITHAFSPHLHEGFAIGVIERGAEQFAYRHAQHVAPAGSLVVINPGEVHTGEAAHASGWVYRMMYPEADVLQRAAAELAGRQRDVPFFPDPIIHDDELAQMFVRLHSAFAESSSALERESRLLWLLSHLITRYADDHAPPRSAAPEHSGVQRARAYMEQHYADNVTLDSLAAAANLSPFHLLRVFRRAVGLPPHAYLTSVRVQQARRLLRTDLSIAAVAAQTGFVDQSHLTRHFKRIVGVPPGHYRQNSKNLQDKPR